MVDMLALLKALQKVEEMVAKKVVLKDCLVVVSWVAYLVISEVVYLVVVWD